MAPKTRTLQGGAALLGLEARWRRLESEAWRVPASFGLLRILLGETPDCRVVVVEDEEQLLGVWPFALQSAGPLVLARRLAGPFQLYDGPTVHRRADPVAVTRAAWKALCRWSGVDLVQLPAILEDSPLLHDEALRSEARPSGQANLLDLRAFAQPQDHLAIRSTKRRKRLRRYRRALEKEGPLRVDEPLAPADRLEVLRWALRTKEAWLDEQNQLGAIFRSRSFQDTLLAAVQDPQLRGILRLYTLSVGERLAAVELGFLDGRTHRAYLGAFEPDFAASSPGTLLLVEVIDRCVADGLEAFDLLPPTSEYKRRWTDQHPAVLGAVWPLTRRGRLAAPAMRDGRDKAKALYGRLPGAVQQGILRARKLRD